MKTLVLKFLGQYCYAARRALERKPCKKMVNPHYYWLAIVTLAVVGGCSSIFINRFPSELRLTESTTAIARFTAQAADWHQLHLIFKKKDLSFQTIKCLLGEFSKNSDACDSADRAIEIVWSVRTYPEGVPIVSGKSTVANLSDTTFANEWVGRYLGKFSPTQGITYEIHAHIVNPTNTVIYTEPKVIIRIPTPNSW